MKISHYILATAGHVDHGKSVLVQALTGTDPDRLPEEKARGITIDLGFAFLELATVERRFEVGIIDVPGHEDFVKNMVAGMGSIDAALLVVAADDGWMPQTQEHLEILNYLGVSRGVVAVTKADLGGTEAVAADVRRRLRGTSLEDAAIVPTSAKTGAGMVALKAALAGMLEKTPAPRDIGKPRLSVDRIFSLRGIGTVVTGALSGGVLTRGQALRVMPGEMVTRARTLQTHGKDVAHALPGMRTALNLPDIGQGEVTRGDVITLPYGGTAVEAVVAALWRFSEKGKEDVAIRNGARVHLHVGSAETGATVQLANREGTAAIARLRLEKPVFTVLGDRFVVRDWSARQTLAGGMVTDLAAGRGWHLREAALRRRAEHPHEATVWVETQLAWDLAASAVRLLEQSHFSAGEVAAAVASLERMGRLKRVGEFIVEAAWWEGLRRQVVEAVAAHHRARPQDQGMPLAALHERMRHGTRRMGAALFARLLADVAEVGLATAGTFIKRVGHAPALPAELRRAGDVIRAALAGRPMDPLSKKELSQAPGAREAMTFLVTAGEVVMLGDEAVMSSEALDEAIRKVRAYLAAHGRATVSELKAMLGTSRRIAVPLLEMLDQRGVTARRGDVRVLAGAGEGVGNVVL